MPASPPVFCEPLTPPALVPALPPFDEPPLDEPPLDEPPFDEPPLDEPDAPLPPPSRSSLSPPQPTMAVAPSRVAPKANVAARPSRIVGSTGGGVFASESPTLQKGHAD